MTQPKRTIALNAQGVALLSGDEAIALAALHCGVTLGTGYPGTPSTEILETFSDLGGKAQWAPNEKVAAEVALGVAFASGRALVTMKHVGLNVAADVLFTSAYSGVSGGYVLACADDPGMASSQNEQDTRRYAVAAGVPMLEPSNSQEAYDFAGLAFAISERWQIPVILRITTRVCHSHTIVKPHGKFTAPPTPCFVNNIPERVMVPAHARPAHRRLRKKLAEIKAWNESEGPHRIIAGSDDLGIITSGIATMHALEAAPGASVLQLGMTHPLPMDLIRSFASRVKRCVAIEEGDPCLNDALRAAGVRVEPRLESYRFGELNVTRVRHLLAGGEEPQTVPPRMKPPQLCEGCPHRSTFSVLKELDCIVAGDIGCYTLAAMPPLQALNTQICMGASIGMGLGMRHTLPEDQARRVVSVIGDSTFLHSGVTGLIEMAYNPPATGHVVVIVDNSTTAMTGLQEHPGTGRKLDHSRASKVAPEEIARALGIPNVQVFNPVKEAARFKQELQSALASSALSVFIARQSCILAFGKIKAYEKAIAEAPPACDDTCAQPVAE
ncbi:MAG: thiamine pyrophosphate-dependent enzyme [Verrucomicrobiota bacterium]